MEETVLRITMEATHVNLRQSKTTTGSDRTKKDENGVPAILVPLA
jgi:hypothetical protein